MFVRFHLVLLVLCAVAAPALAQAVAQPNRAAEVTTLSPEDQRLTRLAQQFASKPSTQPATNNAVAPASPAKPATLGTEAAPLVNSNEKLPLGRGATALQPGTGTVVSEGNPPWMMTTLAALGVVVGLILVLRIVFAKMTGRTIASSHSPVVEVLTRTNVAPKNHVLLLRLGRRILVVGDSAAGMTTLADIEDPEEVASLLQSIAASKPGSSTAGFSQLLHGFNGQYGEEDEIGPDHGTDKTEHHVDRARDNVRGLLSRLRGAGKGDRP